MGQHDTVASFTVRGAREMTPKERKTIAAWLVRQARFLVKEGDNFAGRFRARYMSRARKRRARAIVTAVLFLSAPAASAQTWQIQRVHENVTVP